VRKENLMTCTLRPQQCIWAIVAGIVLLAMLPGGALAVTYHVDDSAPPGGAGLSWPTAFSDLQTALAAATPDGSDLIIVAQGTYHPAGPGGSRSASFVLIEAVTLNGGYIGYNEPEPEIRDAAFYATTILSGDLNSNDEPNFTNYGENSLNVVRTGQDVDQNTVMEGFTVQGGNGDLFLNWGCTDPPGPCPGDINGDGVVNVGDLVEVLTNWGATCELQGPPPGFWECIERCGPTNPTCILTCAEIFGLY
jgi:hypothetical protein